MKKTIPALILIFTIAIAGCGDKCPENIYSTTYEIGQKAVKCYEEYQNGKMLNADMISQLEKYYDDLNALEFNETVPIEVEYMLSNVYVKSNILGIIVLSNDETANKEEILQALGKIRDCLKTGNVPH